MGIPWMILPLPHWRITCDGGDKNGFNTDNGASGISVGDVVHFFISVENTGPDILNNLSFVDTLKDARNKIKALTTSVTFVSGTTSSTSSTIQIGGTVTFTTTFNIDQESIDSGGLYNTITFEANSARNPVPAEKDVKDISDDGLTGAGDTGKDPTFVLLGIDTDNDGKPDTTDIDDDNDGILDRDEKCLTYVLDGESLRAIGNQAGLYCLQKIKTPSGLSPLQRHHLALSMEMVRYGTQPC